MQKTESLSKAKAYAFLLLKFRQRSLKELSLRLEKKKFDPQVIKQTLAFLREKGFIDDRSFTKIWLESRLKKSLGLRRLRQELKAKGVDEQIISDSITEIKKNYSEKEIVTSIYQGRLKKLKGIDPQKAKRRVYAYLLRRGFSPEIVLDIIGQDRA